MTDHSRKTDFNDLFDAIRPTRGFEGVVRQIQGAIGSGELNIGDRLPSERDLSGLFNVSRTTVREAIRFLEAERVVEVRRGAYGGVVIAEPKPERVGRSLETLLGFRGATFEELADFRADFEGQTAFLAAERRTEEEVETLLKITEQLMELAQNRDASWKSFIELDLSFHEEVAKAAHNKIYLAIFLGIHALIKKSGLSLERAGNLAFRIKQADSAKEIVSAIQQKDPAFARNLMRHHVKQNIETKIKLNNGDKGG